MVPRIMGLRFLPYGLEVGRAVTGAEARTIGKCVHGRGDSIPIIGGVHP